jgi:hypothetical protein
MGQFFAALGLKLNVRGDVELEDVEARLERCQVSDEAAMQGACLPVG